MKNSLLALFVLGLMLTACESGTSTVEVEGNTETTDETVETEEAVTEPEAVLYTWAKHGLSFEVPEGLMVSDHVYIDALLLDTSDLSNYLGQLTIRPMTEATMEEALAKYSDESAFTQEEVVFNGKTYGHVSFYSSFGDYEANLYLIENNGTIYSVSKNWTGTQEDLELILETLEF